MKKYFLAAILTIISNTASAQMTTVDADLAANLQLGITQKGFACAQVVNVEPVGSTGAKITCILVEGNDTTSDYLFSVTADGLSITEE